ncbi:hypothetical protein [Erythrobacter mangrovi]|uniref:Uncharacterized protein n=1 Tax=Erythrobacter mangrovi TaxID=2739433 RepID=A0A7D3XNW9_9SPHN|nr:hypothetical protein [Erythrobacter mangrovi]QKG70634.1 hypothetical protein HQR01_04190 [Erythrobacter mangrovi]
MSHSRIVTLPTIVVVAVWGCLIAVLAQRGGFQAQGSLPPVNILLAAVLPPATFYAAFRFSKRVRDWVLGFDLPLIIALQGWRVVGAAFVFYWGYGLLPAAFAAPAGIGDIAVGLMAPFVAIKVARKLPGWERAANGLILAGMTDFIVAFSMGIALRDRGGEGMDFSQHTGLLAEFPLTMIPSFLVPMFIILHLIAYLNMRGARG